ncbi:MAG: hypothetical protein OSB00_03610 [Sphingomonas bacterium]|nr:hypothetical protein [Sphingomonas bacterium]
MRRAAAIAIGVLVIAGCSRAPSISDNGTTGSALEAAAQRTGLIVDPATIDPVGAWARATDRVCVVPAADGKYRVGALIDYGAGQNCAASGIAERRKDGLRIDFGACRIDARLSGDRLIFPATVDEACARYCRGRASFAALSVDHVSDARSEAVTLRAPDRTPLCPA